MQCHSFLGGGLVFGPIALGAGSVVSGCNSVFVSDTTLEEGAVVGPCSTIMRGDRVPSRQQWQGNPATVVQASRLMKSRNAPVLDPNIGNARNIEI